MKLLKAVFHTLFFLVLVAAGLIILSFGHIPGGYRSYVVLSGSMLPMIAPGSLIIVQPKEEYRIGDVVTRATSNPKVTITHRIVEAAEGKFRTKGDANLAADGELFGEQDILGAVRWMIPGVGRIVNYAQTKQGFIVMIVIPSTLIVLEEVISIIGAVRAKRRHKEYSKLDRLKVL